MLDKDSLESFKGALSAALRTTSQADDALSSRFVELRPGMMQTLGSPVNHLITGRRGVGKSTTLAVLQKNAQAAGSWVVFVDVETRKSRAYPDVLIEIVLDILVEIVPSRWRLDHFQLRREISQLERVLAELRDAAPEVTEHAEVEDRRSSEYRVALRGGVAKRFLKLTGSAGRSRKSSAKRSRISIQTRRKEEFLRDLAPVLSSVLERAAKAKGSGSLLLVLDDFYFIAQEMQPSVLDHLHGITKRSNVWLKVGSVDSRTKAYQDGDPPLGMQPPNDVQHLSLDVGLSDFSTAKTFLEEVTDGVLGPIGLRVRDVLTETARERAVLVAGGAVSRDYFDLLISAADAAWETSQRLQNRVPTFRISAENIQSAAGRRLDRKQRDLRNDAGRDSVRLEDRFADITKFARDRDTYFFLVRRDELDSTWGREIVELEDLRFVHRIVSTRPNTGTMRGVDATVFMVDIPALVQQRMQKVPIEFWKPRKLDELRRAGWVYGPDWAPTNTQKSQPRGVVVVATEPAESKNVESGTAETSKEDGDRPPA